MGSGVPAWGARRGVTLVAVWGLSALEAPAPCRVSLWQAPCGREVDGTEGKSTASALSCLLAPRDRSVRVTPAPWVSQHGCPPPQAQDWPLEGWLRWWARFHRLPGPVGSGQRLQPSLVPKAFSLSAASGSVGRRALWGQQQLCCQVLPPLSIWTQAFSPTPGPPFSCCLHP